MTETDKLNNIVNNLIKEFTGGEVYFDNLDEVLRKKENLDIIQKLFSPLKNSNVIVSGKFGYYILGLFNKKTISVNSLIVVNGGLRGGLIKDIILIDFKRDSEYTFVDDSFYKGRTMRKVKEFLEIFDCKLKNTMVVYDGSIDKQDNVSSMYRYHL